MAGQQESLIVTYLGLLEAGTLTFTQANDSRLEPMQRQALLNGLAQQAVLAGADLDSDDDAANLAAIQAEVAAQTVTLGALLTTISGSVDGLETLSQAQIDELQLILTQLQTANTTLSTIDTSTAAAAATLLTIASTVGTTLSELSSFRSENAAALVDVNNELDAITTGIGTIASNITALYDYEEQLGKADNDGRLIVRSTWINQTTGAKTVIYYEQDGVTVTTDVFADVQDVEYYTTVTRWRTSGGGDPTDFYLHTTFAVEDGISTIVQSVYRDALGVTPASTPAGLVPYDESDSVKQRQKFFNYGSATGGNTAILIASLAQRIVVATFTVIKWDEPDKFINISDAPSDAGIYSFSELYESKTFEVVGDLSSLLFAGSLTLEQTAVATANVVQVTIQYRD